jgi:hypothetical protein
MSCLPLCTASILDSDYRHILFCKFHANIIKMITEGMIHLLMYEAVNKTIVSAMLIARLL